MQSKFSASLFLLAILLPALGFSQVSGDYRSVASGGYATAATWEKYNGTAWAAATAAPGSAANVTVQSGHIISLNGSTSNSLTLNVQAGASIIADGTAQRSLRVYGTSLINNGTIGGAFANDSINIEIAGNGVSCTLSGTGLTKVNRLRVLGALTGTNVVVDQDMICNNAGSTGGSAVGFTLYYGSTSTAADNLTTTINSGRTLSMTGGGTLHYASTTTASTSGNYTYNVNGTLDLTGSTGTTYMIPNSLNSSSLLKLNVAGLFKVGSKFTAINTAPGTTPGSVQLVVNPGGVVDASASSIFTCGTTPFIMNDGTGIMKRVVAAIDTAFPVCIAAGGFNNIVLNNSGTVDTFSVKLKNTFDLTLADATKVVNRQWTVSEAVAGGSSLTVKLSWLAADQASAFVSSTGVNIYVVDAGGVQTVFPATVSGTGVLADPYIAIASGITSVGKVFVGNAGVAPPPNDAPSFTGGLSQNLVVCTNASATSVNTLLAVADADAGQTETWSVITNATHGTAAASYTTTSTGATLTPTGLTFTPAASYSGTDSFTVRVSDGTDADTIKVLVTVTPLPAAGTLSGAGSVCAGSSVTLTSTVSGGSWTSGNAFATVGSATGVVTGTSAGIALISYTYTNTCGSATATVNVTVNPSGSGVSAGTISGSSSVCAAAQITLTDGVSGGVWSASNTNASITSAGVVTGSVAGTVAISYTVTNVCGSAVATQFITVNPLPVSGTISGASTVCVSATTTLSNTGTGGAWSVTNANASVSASGLVSGLAAGVDTVRYTVTNGCGNAVAAQTVTVNPLVTVAAISGASTACAASTITLTNTTSGGVWSASNATATVSATGVITGVAAGVDTISYAVTNTCNTATAVKVITVNPLPVAGSISGSSSVCVDVNIALTSSGGAGAWSASNTSASISGSGLLAGLSAGIDTVTYTVTNVCGTATATKTITVNPLPVAGTITGPSSVCVGADITVADVATGGVWSSGNASATIAATGVVSGVSAGVDSIFYMVTNVCGIATAMKVITVNPLPVAGAVSGLSAVCPGAAISLSSTAAGGLWSVSNTYAVIDGGGTVNGLSAGIDTVYYTVTNVCGTDVAIKVITVNPLPAAGAVSGASGVCVGSAVSLSASVSGGVWSASNTSASVASGLVSGNVAGADTIIYTYTNSCGSDVASKVVTVNPLPDAGSISGPASVCEGLSITLVNSVSGGVWSSSSATASITTAGIATGLVAGADTALYSVTNVCGTDVASFPIAINAQPHAGIISGIDTLCQGDTTSLVATLPSGIWFSTSNFALVSGTGLAGGIAPGLDTILYVVSNVCGADTAVKTIRVLSLAECGSTGAAIVTQTQADVNIYPNPNSGVFTLSIKAATTETANVSVCNMVGQKLQNFTTTTNSTNNVRIDKCAPGVYFVNIAWANGSRTEKISIQ